MTHIYVKPSEYDEALKIIDTNGNLSIVRLQQKLLISKDKAKKIAAQLLLDFPDIKIEE